MARLSKLVAAMCVGLGVAGMTCDSRDAACGEDEAPSLVQLKDGGCRRRRATRAPVPAPTTALPLAPELGIEQPSFLAGGWCQAAYGNTCTWGPGANVILPGGFQADASVPPNPSNWNTYTYDEVWLTLGGMGVTGSPESCYDANFISKTAASISATGVCFDMEGCYEPESSALSKLKTTVAAVKALSPNLKFMFTPAGDGAVTQYADVKDTFDVLAAMYYWGDTSYQQDDITCDKVMGWANKWISAGWPVEKMFLTFQSKSAATAPGQEVLSCITEKAKSGGYLGVLGWPVVPADAAVDQANLALVTGPPVPSPVPSPTPSPSGCSAHCSSGAASGQCCDVTATTSLGSCRLMGQEGCCGDPSDTQALCQRG